jgi:flagellin
MAVVINSNVTSMRAQAHLGRAQSALADSFERLSSGQRINSASDDAGSIALSESLNNQTRSYAVAERNGMNGVSMVETAEGGLGEIHGVLGRMRELAMQSANGDLNSSDRTNLNTEFQELLSEAGRVIKTTEFNGTSLLDGTAASVGFQVGIKTTANDAISVSFGGVTTAASDLDVDGTDVTSVTNAKTAIDKLDTAINSVSGKRATFGAKMNRLKTAVSNANTMRTNLSAAFSRVTDTDVASEAAAMARSQVLQQAGASMLAQANAAPQIALALLR